MSRKGLIFSPLRTTLFLGITILFFFSAAPPSLQASTRPIEKTRGAPLADTLAECTANNTATVARHQQTGRIRFIGAPGGQTLRTTEGNMTGSPESAARAFLSACGSFFGIQDAQGDLSTMREATLPDGRSVVRFQQLHRGVPVLGGELNVQMNSDKNVTVATGEALPQIRVSTTPKVDAAQARAAAVERIARVYQVNPATLETTQPQLWIYNPVLIRPGGGFTQLVWRMDVTSTELLEVRELVLVDAQRGGVALHFNQVDSAKNRQTYTASGGTSLPGTLVCNESNPTCSGGDADAVNAHKYAGETYDFYFNNHNRDGINNAGLTMVSTVHYGVGYQNAFWDGSQMVYGDGFSQADDVVGHELTHGVTQYESGLFYYYQSGAINESLSDVWGEFVDLTNTSGTDTAGARWLMGEDLPSIGAIRSMKDPPLFSDPDKMTSPHYYAVTCGDFNSNCDNGGVHINSGVNNKATYLMVDGDTFNGKTVTGLGIPKVAKIYFEVQANLLTSGSDYADLYTALAQACQNLIAGGVTTAGDCQQVQNAIDAVEMNLQPVTGYNPDAPLCASGAPNNVFFDNLESGTGNWTFGATAGTSAWSLDSSFFGSYAHSGTHSLYGDDFYASSASFAAMNSNVMLPSNAFLHFYHAYGFEDPNWDGGRIEYSTDGGTTWNDAGSLIDANGYDGTLDSGNVLGAVSAFLSDSHGYISTRLDLASLAGQNVRFRFRLGTDPVGFDRGWWVDDVRIYTCGSGGAAGPVFVEQVTTTNKKSQVKKRFLRGEKIWYWAQLRNDGSLNCTVASEWRSAKKGTVLHTWSGNLDVAPGTSWWILKRRVPTNAVIGKYKFTMTTNCGGQISMLTATFRIVAAVAAAEGEDRVLEGAPEQSAGAPRRE